jgi:hypothetical protein
LQINNNRRSDSPESGRRFEFHFNNYWKVIAFRFVEPGSRRHLSIGGNSAALFSKEVARILTLSSFLLNPTEHGISIVRGILKQGVSSHEI